MKTRTQILKNLVRTVFGLFVFAIGVALEMQSNIGMAPWETLAVGVSKHLPFSFGIHFVIFRDIGGFHICSIGKFARSSRRYIRRLTRYDQMIHIMLLGKAEQQRARLRRIVMTSVRFINSISYIAPYIGFCIITDPEVTIADLCFIK